MKIIKKSEMLYQIEFDETEVKNLEDIEDIFEVTPDEVIERSVSESLRLGEKGIHNLLDVVTGRKKI